MRCSHAELHGERGEIATQRLRAEDTEPNLAPPAGARGSYEVRQLRRGKVLVHGRVEPSERAREPVRKCGAWAVTLAFSPLAEEVLERVVAKVGPVAPAALEAADGVPEPVWKSTSASGAPDISSLSHFSTMTRPSGLGRAVRNRHRHTIEQASRRWRGGRRGDSARTRRKSLISTQTGA